MSRMSEMAASTSTVEKKIYERVTHLQLQWSLPTLQHFLDLHRLLVEMLDVLFISVDLVLQGEEYNS